MNWDYKFQENYIIMFSSLCLFISVFTYENAHAWSFEQKILK